MYESGREGFRLVVGGRGRKWETSIFTPTPQNIQYFRLQSSSLAVGFLSLDLLQMHRSINSKDLSYLDYLITLEQSTNLGRIIIWSEREGEAMNTRVYK